VRLTVDRGVGVVPTAGELPAALVLDGCL